MKLFLIFMLFLMSSIVMAKPDLSKPSFSKVPTSIVVEESVKAFNQFESEFEVDCASGKILAGDCELLRDRVKTARYDARLLKYKDFVKAGRQAAVDRFDEMECVRKLRDYFDEQEYSHLPNDDCVKLKDKLLINEPLVVEPLE